MDIKEHKSHTNSNLHQDATPRNGITVGNDVPGTSRCNILPKEYKQIMNYESARWETFKNWPKNKPDIDIKLMALSGFYYTNYLDNVKCNFCDLSLRNWTPYDDIISSHLKSSPSCPLLRHRIETNIPINYDEMNSKLPPVSYDVTGLEDYIESDEESNSVYFEYPEFKSIQRRLESFKNWPTGLSQKPNDLAEAGFLYTGLSDKVLCFSCKLGLKEWATEDIPIEEHVRWASACDFIQSLKSEEYISFIKKKYENLDNTENNDENVLNEVSRSEPELEGSVILSCKICFDNPSDIVFLPCGHIVACRKCSNVLTICQLCKRNIETKVKVFYG